MKGGSEDPFSTLFTGSITAKIGGSIMPIIDRRVLHGPPRPDFWKFDSLVRGFVMKIFRDASFRASRYSGI